jgi:TPR repeat protein
VSLYKKAAELEDAVAQWRYGEFAFVDGDWEKFHWLGRSAAQGFDEACFGVREGAINGRKLYEKGGSGAMHLASVGGRSACHAAGSCIAR